MKLSAVSDQQSAKSLFLKFLLTAKC